MGAERLGNHTVTLGFSKTLCQEVDERQGEVGQEGLGSMEGVGLGVAPGAAVV